MLYRCRCGGFRIVDSEGVSGRLSKEKVVCSEAELERGTGIVKGLVGGNEDSGCMCLQDIGSGSERSNLECLRRPLQEVGIRIDLRGKGSLLFLKST